MVRISSQYVSLKDGHMSHPSAFGIVSQFVITWKLWVQQLFRFSVNLRYEITLGRIAALVCWGILFTCTCLLLLHIIRSTNQSMWSTRTRPVDDGSWRRCRKLTQCAAKPKHKEIFVLNNESSVLYKKKYKHRKEKRNFTAKYISIMLTL